MKIYKIIIVVLILLLIGGVGCYIISKYSKNTPDVNEPNINDVEKYDGNKTTINLDDLTYNGTGLTIKDNTIYIMYGGTYELSGITNSNIKVESTDGKDIYLILNNVNITSNEVPIYIESGNTYITLEGNNNITCTDKSNENQAIFSKNDITIDGTGTLTIKSNFNGIVSKDNLVINGGTFDITSGTGYSYVAKQEDFGNNTSSNDDISAKSIKADNITINNGTFTISTSDDGIHSNGNLTINNGDITIKSSDDAIHADGLLEINKGNLNLTASEGLEATYVKINNGNINIDASDDGINAGNKSEDYEVTIEINGGNITIKMASGDTDGIDSNGNLYINGGTIDITCNSPFDYDKEAKYTGGTLIVNGQTTTTITNQMMGGPGQGMMQMDQFMQRRR